MMSGKQPFVSDLLWIPQGVDLPEGISIERLKEKVTVQGKAYGDEEAPEPISGWREDSGGIGLPIAFGMDLCESLGIEPDWEMSVGEVGRFSPANIFPMDDEQARVWDLIDERYEEEEITVLCQAPTGFGKTVTAFDQMLKHGRKTLIIVTTRKLARQWSKEAIKFGVRPEEISILASGLKKDERRDPESTSLTIAVVHSIVKKDPDWFTQFGFTVWDEVHRMGAREFSKSLVLCRSRWRLALSATPRRKDGCENLFLNYFGYPSAVGKTQTMPCDVWVVNHPCPRHWNDLVMGGSNISVLLNTLTKNRKRNSVVAEQVNRAYIKDRNILVLSDRIEQIDLIRGLLIEEHEIDEREIGIIAGEVIEDDGSRRKTTDKELDEAEDRRIILATYGMAKEGLNIPRLDWGIDASPRADGEQKIGRIRRKMEGKKRPIWITIRDSSIDILKGYFRARVKEYIAAEATMKNYVND